MEFFTWFNFQINFLGSIIYRFMIYFIFADTEVKYKWLYSVSNIEINIKFTIWVSNFVFTLSIFKCKLCVIFEYFISDYCTITNNSLSFKEILHVFVCSTPYWKRKEFRSFEEEKVNSVWGNWDEGKFRLEVKKNDRGKHA